MVDTPVIFGEVLFDCFEDGSRVLGGAPFNVAWHLQAFGCSPLFISRVGDDSMARLIRDTMLRWGMTTAGLQKDLSHGTGEVKVKLQDGQPNYEIVADRAYDHIDADVIPPCHPALVYHGSLGLRAPQAETALAELLERHAAPVFLDVNLRPPWWNEAQVTQLLARAQWVKINDNELNTLIAGTEPLTEKAKALIATHELSLAIVTQGADGAFAMGRDGNRVSVAPEPATQIVDTVGAGDAFASVCILGLLHNWPVDVMMQRAQRFAALLVGQRGATAEDRSLYQPLIEDWQLEQ